MGVLTGYQKQRVLDSDNLSEVADLVTVAAEHGDFMPRENSCSHDHSSNVLMNFQRRIEPTIIV